MPEDQKPFIHQDGSSTPPTIAPRNRYALDPTLLGKSRTVLQAISTAITRSEANVEGGSTSMLLQARAVDRAGENLELLMQPSINATVAAMTVLPPTMQALVSDIAVALATAGTGRQILANDLRKRVEGRS